MKKIRNIIDISDLTILEIDSLIETAQDMSANKEKYAHACSCKKIATLFFEPSTRTRLSFEAAMYDLGGNALGFASASLSSTTKGETVMDTVRVVGEYVDIIAMRHPLEGAAFAAAQKSIVPIINAGDGGHCHPTQTLADLLTIKNQHGRLDHLTVGICGDLKYGRTVHSLITALSRYEGNKFVMISPVELGIPSYIENEVLEPSNAEWTTCLTIEDCISTLDILYMTRVQKERFSDLCEYERLKNCYVLNTEKMKSAKDTMCVLHPLPRVKEISVDVDDDNRACYFKQVANGKLMRMALILKLLKDSESETSKNDSGSNAVKNDSDIKTIKNDIASETVKVDEKVEIAGKYICKNPKCVTASESDLVQIAVEFALKGQSETICRCKYCDFEVK